MLGQHFQDPPWPRSLNMCMVPGTSFVRARPSSHRARGATSPGMARRTSLRHVRPKWHAAAQPHHVGVTWYWYTPTHVPWKWKTPWLQRKMVLQGPMFHFHEQMEVSTSFLFVHAVFFFVSYVVGRFNALGLGYPILSCLLIPLTAISNKSLLTDWWQALFFHGIPGFESTRRSRTIRRSVQNGVIGEQRGCSPERSGLVHWVSGLGDPEQT